MIWLAWHIWKSRNDFVFKYHPFDPCSIIFKAEKDFGEFARVSPISQHSTSHLSSLREESRSWIPPRQGRFKANCDVAIRPGSSRVSTAVLLRDCKGSVVEGAVRMEGVRSVMQGEAMAVRWACLMARSLNPSQVEIAGDNKAVICLCDIRRLANQCNFSFLWTPREANSAAHWTARAFLNGVLPSNWVCNPPEGLCKALALVS
ncbi:hypothetical protein CsSME_00050572 [Camellia sinensis var. sinensis]